MSGIWAGGEGEKGMPERTSEKDEDVKGVTCLASPSCLRGPHDGWPARGVWRSWMGRALNTELDFIKQTSGFQTVLLRAWGFLEVPGAGATKGKPR